MIIDKLNTEIKELQEIIDRSTNKIVIASAEAQLEFILNKKRKILSLEKQSNKTNKINDKIKLIKEKIKFAELQNDLAEYKKLRSEYNKLRKKLYKIDKIKYLTKKELNNFFTAFDKLDYKNKDRDWLMAKLGYECGLRVSEIIDLKVEDYNFKSKKLFCNRKKGSNKNYIYLTKETAEKLRTYIFLNDRNNYIFSSRSSDYKILSTRTVNNSLKKYFKLAKIKADKQHFHVFKHSLAVHMLEDGSTFKQVQEMLGHNSIKSTEVYAAFSKRQQYELKKFMKR